MACAGWVDPFKYSTHVGPEHKNATRCIHLNCQSAKNKFDVLDSFFGSFDFQYDFIMLSETWYDACTIPWKLPSYNCFTESRTASRGGGVSLLVKDNIHVNRLEDFCHITDNYEVLSVLYGRIVFSVFYRPPNGNVQAFFSFIEQFLLQMSDLKYSIVWGGDFNIDTLADSQMKRELNILLSTYGCLNTIAMPTRITCTTETCLDLFITNIDPSTVKAGVFSCSISDHMPIFLSLNRSFQKHVPNEIPMTQLITPSRLESFRDELGLLDWRDVYTTQEPDIAYETFLLRFSTCYKKHFPLGSHQKRSAKIRKPWITELLYRKIRIKKDLYNKFIKSREIADLKTFKSFRNNLNNELRRAKARYNEKQFSTCGNDGRKLWKKINLLLNRTQNNHTIERIVQNGTEVRGESLANAFNDYFTKIVTSTVNFNACLSIASCPETMYLRPTNEAEVICLFSELSNSSACDVDGMQIKPAKYCIDIIAPVLAHIYNLCLSTGVFPQKLQVAKVIAIFKKGDKTKMTNYRPISILPVFSKCLEKIIFNRLSGFFESKGLLTECQYAFRKNSSTQHALLEQKEFILKNLETRLLTLGVFIDFSKAFDHINHALLLQKLGRYGIRGVALDLITSYLEHRSQLVVIKTASQSLPVKAGVPQGSILGPLLFNIYINDIVLVDHHTKYVIYADDTTLLFTSNCAASLATTANVVLEKLYRWTTDNGLKINVDKTKALLFQAKNKNITLENDIMLAGSKIEIVSSVKTLGVIFDECLSWTNHINFLAGKLSKVVGMLFCVKYLPLKVKMIIYDALFFSHLNYCCLVWGTTSASNLNQLFLLQKKIIRLICDAPFACPTEPLFRQLHVLKIHHLFHYRLALAYRKDQTSGQNRLCNIAFLNRRVQLYSTRSPEHWQVPRSRTNYGMQMLRHTLPTLLNNLAAKQVDITSLSSLHDCFIS